MNVEQIRVADADFRNYRAMKAPQTKSPTRGDWADFYRDRQRKCRVFFFFNSEAFFKPEEEDTPLTSSEKRALLRAALAEALPRASPDLLDAYVSSATWSRIAGCSCGCSPGFIISHSDLVGCELFATF